MRINALGIFLGIIALSFIVYYKTTSSRPRPKSKLEIINEKAAEKVIIKTSDRAPLAKNKRRPFIGNLQGELIFTKQTIEQEECCPIILKSHIIGSESKGQKISYYIETDESVKIYSDSKCRIPLSDEPFMVLGYSNNDYFIKSNKPGIINVTLSHYPGNSEVKEYKINVVQ